jgi:hypothetical protein
MNTSEVMVGLSEPRVPKSIPILLPDGTFSAAADLIG